jgi:hypothetical protein
VDRTYKCLNCFLRVSLHAKETSTDTKEIGKIMSLSQKVEVLHGGMRIATVGRYCGLTNRPFVSARKAKTRSREALSMWSVDCDNFLGPCVAGR